MAKRSGKARASATARPKTAARPPAPQREADVNFEITTSRQFESWLAEHRVNIAFTTYQAGKLFFLGVDKSGRLSIFNRNIERCMGLAYADGALYMATLYQILKFVDAIGSQPAKGAYAGYDSLFLPQVSYYTGDVDAHDIAIGSGHEIFFANTLFSCIATTSTTHSFRPVWKPAFIDRLAAEDRCHLNGLALDGGKPRYATAVAQVNIADGWRDHRENGGILIDIGRNEILLSGLSMPHSPRLWNGKLWLHDSGTGYFGCVEPAGGKFERVAFCPGYLRGADFVKNYAIVGLSKPRDKTFSGLPLDDNLAKNKVDARCGLYVIDLNSGDVVHWMRIEGVITELYDVAVLPDRTNTAAIGFRSEEIRRVISIEG